MKNEKTVIEINGVKMEIDLRHARRVENISVGTRVKVLVKKYADTYEVRHGLVIGFEPFKSLPTIIIAVCKIDYQNAQIEFVYFNTASKDIEITVASDDDLASLDKNDFIKSVDREIAAANAKILECEQRKAYFLDKFKCFWEPIEQAVADATSEL